MFFVIIKKQIYAIAEITNFGIAASIKHFVIKMFLKSYQKW